MDNSKMATQQNAANRPPGLQSKKRLKIYVCSPYRLTSLTKEDMEQERREIEKRIRMACWLIVQMDAIPYAPHGYFTHFLDDSNPFEREKGMELGLAWLKECDELWVFGERISDGMAKEIAFAKENGIPVLCRQEPQEIMEHLLVELKKKYGPRDDNADAAEDVAEMEEQNGKED